MRDDLLEETFQVLRRIVGLARPHKGVLDQLHPGLLNRAWQLVEKLHAERLREAAASTSTRDCYVCRRPMDAVHEGPCLTCVEAAQRRAERATGRRRAPSAREFYRRGQDGREVRRA